jgi:hypothetical protein
MKRPAIKRSELRRESRCQRCLVLSCRLLMTRIPCNFEVKPSMKLVQAWGQTQSKKSSGEANLPKGQAKLFHGIALRFQFFGDWQAKPSGICTILGLGLCVCYFGPGTRKVNGMDFGAMSSASRRAS